MTKKEAPKAERRTPPAIEGKHDAGGNRLNENYVLCAPYDSEVADAAGNKSKPTPRQPYTGMVDGERNATGGIGKLRRR